MGMKREAILRQRNLPRELPGRHVPDADSRRKIRSGISTVYDIRQICRTIEFPCKEQRVSTQCHVGTNHITLPQNAARRCIQAGKALDRLVRGRGLSVEFRYGIVKPVLPDNRSLATVDFVLWRPLHVQDLLPRLHVQLKDTGSSLVEGTTLNGPAVGNGAKNIAAVSHVCPYILFRKFDQTVYVCSGIALRKIDRHTIPLTAGKEKNNEHGNERPP